MENLFSSLKTERIYGRIYRSHGQARADVFDDIECFYNPRRSHATIGYFSPMEEKGTVGRVVLHSAPPSAGR